MIYGPFYSVGRFGHVGGPFWMYLWVVLDLAMGRFRHIENLWAALVHGLFWYRPIILSHFQGQIRYRQILMAKSLHHKL